MNLRDDLRELKSGPRDLRKFGLLVGGVFTAIGILLLIRGRPRFPFFLAPGLLLMVLGTIWPRVLKPLYLAWMSVAIVMGFCVSHLILFLFFFLVMTPVGLVARCAGRDFLRLKLDRQAPTYWQPRTRRPPQTKQEYEQQY
jgi:Saxitoxin biosynthesis operon protein SxtJ